MITQHSQTQTALVPEKPLNGLPGIDRPIDNTALQAYMTCPREYFFSMILHRRKAESAKSPALGFGSLWHDILAMHYKSGGVRELVQARAYKTGQGHDSPDDYRTLDRALLDYDKYVKRELVTLDVQKTIGYPEAPLIEIATNAQGDGLLHPWAGKLDRIIELGGLIYVEDHKTTSRFDKNYWMQYELSNQMKGYTYLASQLFPELKIAGVRINLSHVLTASTEFNRKLFSYPADVMQDWITTTNEWLLRLSRDSEAYASALEISGDPWEAALTTFPAHYGDNACSRKFGLCSYHEVCSLSPRLRRRFLEANYDIYPWNPLTIDGD